MAKIKMANMTSNPICIRGAKALKMDFKTTCKPKQKGNNGISKEGREKYIIRYWKKRKKNYHIRMINESRFNTNHAYSERLRDT